MAHSAPHTFETLAAMRTAIADLQVSIRRTRAMIEETRDVMRQLDEDTQTREIQTGQ